ncbi:MAG: SHOCT domain-containing protein [Pontibacter sp.]|nr:SHOCT domain-containing protein [Pontibacter sp.]
MDILKRRYAAGEIDTEEYNFRKRELEKDDFNKS